MTTAAVRRANRLPLWVMLVCFALPPHAHDAVAQTAPTPADDAANVTNDAEVADLLHKAERQISAGHVVAPAEDSALETWSLILQHQAAAPNSAAIRGDLLEFATLARSRAVEEKEAGRVPVAIDFTVFADLASQLLTHMADPKSPDTPAPPPRASATPPPPQPQPQPTPAAAAPTPPAPAPVPANLLPSPAPASVPATVPDPAAAEFYLHRGDAMLAKKDISAARKFYEFAANAGSARAASALARTHEPGVLAQLGAVGIKPDPNLAKFWYSRAAALGDREAQSKLQALGTAAAK